VTAARCEPQEWGHMCANMVATRPSAPDLFRCIEQMKKAASSHRGTHGKLLERLSQRADELRDARGVLDKKLAETGEALIEDGVRIDTDRT
jgi:methylthioribose-1-phosphate isomerase